MQKKYLYMLHNKNLFMLEKYTFKRGSGFSVIIFCRVVGVRHKRRFGDDVNLKNRAKKKIKKNGPCAYQNIKIKF